MQDIGRQQALVHLAVQREWAFCAARPPAPGRLHKTNDHHTMIWQPVTGGQAGVVSNTKPPKKYHYIVHNALHIDYRTRSAAGSKIVQTCRLKRTMAFDPGPRHDVARVGWHSYTAQMI